MVVHVDYVMRNTSLARIRDARLQLDVAHTARLYQAQCPGGERHDHVVKKMNMVTSVRARRKPPLRDDDAIVVDLDGGGCIHGWSWPLIGGSILRHSMRSGSSPNPAIKPRTFQCVTSGLPSLH